jgi:hypothetical protein
LFSERVTVSSGTSSAASGILSSIGKVRSILSILPISVSTSQSISGRLKEVVSSEFTSKGEILSCPHVGVKLPKTGLFTSTDANSRVVSVGAALLSASVGIFVTSEIFITS